MRTTLRSLVLFTVTLTLSGGSAWGAEKPASFFKKFLNSGKSRSSRVQQPAPRVAQARRQPVPPSSAGLQSMTPQQAEQHAKQVQAKVERQFSGLQRQLDQEQARLNATLSGLAKKRQAAVAAGNAPELKQIERTEASVIKTYESRVSRILAGASNPHATLPAGGVKNLGGRGARPQKPAPQPEQPKRRMRLWPFR